MNDNLRRWLPWIAVAAVAIIVIVIIAVNSGGDDEAADTTTTTAGETTTTEGETTTTTEGETTTTSEAPPEFAAIPVTYGTLLPQTGALASIIDALENGVRLAADEINAASDGLVTLEFGDSGTDPNTASANVDAYLGGGYSGIIGAAASGVSLSIVDKVQESQMLMCSGSNTAAALSSPDYNPFYHRTAPSDVLQAPALGGVVVDDGFQSVAIAYRNDEYGVGFADLLEEFFTGAGAEVATRIGYATDATSFTDVADEIAASGAEALVMITFAEGGQLLLDLQGKFDGGIYVADGFKDTVGADQLGGNVALLEGIRGTAPSASPANGTPGFADRLEAAYPGTPTIFSAHFYDCLMVQTLAAQAAQSADPTVVVDFIIPVTTGGEKCTDFATCFELLSQGADIDYDGASGPLDFGPNGEPGIGTYDIYTYDAEGNANTDNQVVVP